MSRSKTHNQAPAISESRKSLPWCSVLILIFAMELGIELREALADERPDIPQVGGTIGSQRLTVRPVLACVAKLGQNSFAAVFGYQSGSKDTLAIPVGRQNEFLPGDHDDDQEAKYRGQPTSFRPGEHNGVFSVEFGAKELLIWKLDGRLAIATQHSPRCQLQCPLNQGRTEDGQCADLEAPENVLKEDDVADEGPTFGDQQEAEAYILNQVQRFQLGNAFRAQFSSGIQGYTMSLGQVFIPRDDGTIETFDDKFAVAIGGRSRMITVGGVQVCVDDNGCESPPDAQFCDREFCIDGDSFVYDFPPLFSIYHSVGGETGQATGGYQEHGHFCFKFGFIPWRCVTKQGTNDLMVVSSFTNENGDVIGVGRSAGHDTTSVKDKVWGFFVGGSIEIDANFHASGQFTAFHGCEGQLSPAAECRVHGVCSGHSGQGNSMSRTGPPNRSVSPQTSGAQANCGDLIP
jgi:hypothetical protein